jgi:hypothetical protein
MTDRPIIFSGPMVRALIDGRKTQTRRVLKPQPGELDNVFRDGGGHWHVTDSQGAWMSELRIPYAPGDRLWVRESAHIDGREVNYRTDSEAGGANASGWGWRSPIHMPRWASRLTLTVTDVRVQRLQQIRFTDTLAEGVEETDFYAKRHRACLEQNVGCGSVSFDSFADLWNSIHGPDAWDANPWVVALTFTVERRNIDAGAT